MKRSRGVFAIRFGSTMWPHRLGKRHLVIWLADGQAIEINTTSDRGDGLAARDDLEVGEPLVTEPINTSNKTSNKTSNTKIDRCS